MGMARALRLRIDLRQHLTLGRSSAAPPVGLLHGMRLPRHAHDVDRVPAATGAPAEAVFRPVPGVRREESGDRVGEVD